MGVVYDARSDSGRRIAVKVVHQQFSDDAEFRVRFRQEVDAAWRVSGAFTAPVVDADPDAPRPWMATSYVPGPTLTQRITEDGPLSGAELRKLAIGLAEALRDIHRVGVVHRDLKPSNVILSEEGPRVIDFGISRAADHQHLTTTGRVMGTPPFMSPEQFRTPKDVGPETDVFSLATVLVYAASGRSPFEAENPYMTAYQVVHDPPRLGGLPDALCGIVTDCLDKSPSKRPSVAELLERLRDLRADGLPPSGEALVPAPVTDQAHRRRRGAMIAGGALAVVLGTGIAAILAFGSPGGAHGSPQRRPSQASPARASSLPAGWSAWRRTLRSSQIVPAGVRNLGGPRGWDLQHECLVSGSSLYCGGNGIALARIDPATGRPLWQHPSSDATATLVGTSRRGMVTAVVDVDHGDSVTSRLEGYDVGDGKRRWWTDSGSTDQGNVFRDGGSDAVLTQGWDGETFKAVDTRTGRIRWARRASPTLSCHPAVVESRPYAVCDPGSGTDLPESTVIYALDPATGLARKLADVPRTLSEVGSQRSTLVLQDDGNADVLRIDLRSGKSHRVHLSSDYSAAGPTLVGGTLYFVQSNGDVFAVGSSTGKQLWKASTGFGELSPPIAPPGKEGPLYFGTPGGRFVSLDSRNGDVLWRTGLLTDSAGPYTDLGLIGDALYGRYGYDQLTSLDINHPKAAVSPATRSD